MSENKTESRTKKSIHNSAVALLMFCLNLLLQFFSRKIFLDHLGTDILGLNTTATNLLQFLNLAELGIGSAVGFALFKPLFEKDENGINEILSLQGWLYRRIAYFIIGGAAILMCFFPLIFEKITLPLWYAYASFSVLLFSAMLGYFVNYKMILLTADQKDYKLQYAFRLVMMIKVLMQMVAVKWLSNGYIWWLVLEFVFAIISSVAINRTLRTTYPYLKNTTVDFKTLREKHKELITKIKQLFFHKIGTFVLTQTSPLIIYAYTTLTVVALYGNYQLIINGFTGLIIAVFNSMAAGVGNLVASSAQDKIMKVFRELFSIRFVVIFSICLVIYVVTPSFIKIWIGDQYILSPLTLILMIGIFYVMTSRLTVDAFVNGFGLFGDIWAPIAEGILNIGCSIILGAKYGLNGIISGVLISLIASMIIWKPYYLFTRKLKGYYKCYLIDYCKHIVAAAAATVVILQVTKQVSPEICTNFLSLALYAIVVFCISAVILSVILVILPTGLRYFFKRLFSTRTRNIQ
ncbi:MAG: sugar transporter [Bacteroides sp.]|nr:sugar transporter [Bacteroidales bacterium]MBD5305024.1 sugar transporter [Bacteroides sp.]